MFPVLNEIEKHSIIFDQYYATATSTLMVIGDLLYGGMNLYEGCATLADVPTEYCYESSLFDDLKKEGYDTGIYIYPEGGDRESAEARHLAGFNHKMELISNYSEYMNVFEKKMNHEPFALMACNYISNISLNNYVDVTNFGADAGYWEAGFRCMDHCCGMLLELLKDKRLMSNTIIVMYGDHGDDYWGHGMHSGLTHAIEPNSLLIHTPLLICDGGHRESPEHDPRLIQTSDLRELIGCLLGGSSIADLPKRQYVISRNAYAAQPVRPESFNKAYSVTDGRYFLIVSNKGLEFYDSRMDPACLNNILRFFIYENGILKENSDNVTMLGFHFPSYWNSREQRILRQKFYELIKVLYCEVLELYIVGGCDEKQMREEMHFNGIAQ